MSLFVVYFVAVSKGSPKVTHEDCMRNQSRAKKWFLTTWLAVMSAGACLFWFASAANAEFLYGKAEHLETLPPVEQRLQAGAIFDSQLLKEYGSTDGWRKIPRGFAGVRELRGGAPHISTNLRTGVQHLGTADPTYRKLVVVGYQIDNRGQIWDFPLARQEQVGESSKTLEYDFVKRRELLQMSETTMTERMCSIHVSVNKRTNKIKSVFQDDSIEVRTLIAPGRIHHTYSGKIFTAEGRPLNLDEFQNEEKVLREFEPIDFLNGLDLKESFANYREGALSSSGANLR
ncbi:MAG: hypothetical protein K2X29_13445 [Candidatus Obscuribacterales bacterium]|nr:hypothetical protein [Candidatus Obscuribacterales bacterium]